MVITWEGEELIYHPLQATFPNMQSCINDVGYLIRHTTLTPKNDDVDILNDILISQFLGEEIILISYNDAKGDIYGNKSI